jgi:DNA-binding NtrC family response regulator
VLFVEDVPEDVELISRELTGHGFALQSQTVATRADFLRALDARAWDVVLSAHSTRDLDFTAALNILQTRDSDIPFIVVSGTTGEDSAVEAMRAGAHDYVLKQNLSRLGPAVQRELREAANRRMQRETLEALQATQMRLRDAQRLETAGRLAAQIAHDFNNLLTVIMGFTEFVIERLGPEEQARRDAVEIRAAAERAGRLTKQLLALSGQPIGTGPAAQPSPPAPAPEACAQAATILLAEDEHAVRAFLELVLQRAGHLVISTRSGPDALEAGLQSGAIDLFISDVVMPGLSGPEVADQLRRKHPQMKTLFLSGYARHMALPEHVSTDPRGFLQKPFTIDTFTEKVRERLAGG